VKWRVVLSAEIREAIEEQWGCPTSDDAHELEPVITLLDGRTVLRAVFDLVRTLRASGYAITIVGDGAEVRIKPLFPYDTWCVLDPAGRT
jgi:hypothetical protein